MALPFHKLLQTLNSGSSIGSAAVAILASYGADAHVYLPGIGALNGYTLGNYLESTGNTEATVDNPVGLVLDAGQAVSAERMVDGDNEAALMTTVALTRFTGARDASIVYSGTNSGKWTTDGTSGAHYVRLFSVPANSAVTVSGAVRLESGGLAGLRLIDTDDGSLNIVITATTDTWVPFSYTRQAKGSGWTCSLGSNLVETATGKSIWLDNISVKEVPGIHALQGTTANKPILRKPSNNYYWEFDGVNDNLASTSAPFQMADDHCVVMGVSRDTVSFDRYPIYVGTTASVTPLAASILMPPSGLVGALWRDDAGVNMLANSSYTYTANTPFVVSARKTGSNKVCRVNGVDGTVQATVPGATATFNQLVIGNFSTAYLNGKVYPAIAIKGTVSDANLLILERWVGSLTGPTGVVIP